MIGNALIAIGSACVFCTGATIAWAVWCWFAERRRERAVEEANRVVAMRRMSIHLVGDRLVSEEPPRPFDQEID